MVGVIPDAEARELPDRYVHLIRPGDRDKPPGFSQALAWWLNGGEEEAFFDRSMGPSGSLAPTSVAYRFADSIEDANGSTAATDAMQDASMTLMPQAVGAGLFVATARKANPVAALYYGLGAQQSAMLPGWFGNVLLSADEVRTALPRAEEALLLSDTQRSTALSRIYRLDDRYGRHTRLRCGGTHRRAPTGDSTRRRGRIRRCRFQPLVLTSVWHSGTAEDSSPEEVEVRPAIAHAL